MLSLSKVIKIFGLITIFSFSFLQANYESQEYDDTQGWYDYHGQMENDTPREYPYSPAQNNSLQQNPINPRM